MNRQTKWFVLASTCLLLPAYAQPTDDLHLTSVGKDPRWKIAGRTTSIVDVKGKQALKISEGPGMGLVWPEGYDFGNGIIEIDLLGRSRPVQGSLVVKELSGRARGSVGLWVGEGSGGHFANLRVTRTR